MSTPEPPGGSTPPPGEPTPPPGEPTPPPPDPGTVPPPPPPPAGAAAPGAAPSGVGQPGNLLDRFLARLIDGIIVGIVVSIIYAILAAATDYWTTVFINGVVGALLYTGYFAYFESTRGQTIGKQLLKLKTFGPDGVSHPTMNEAVKRNVWYLFEIVPCLGPLAVLVSVILIAVNINSDPQRQHLFDRFAGGTKVLKIG
jgi:uncharacterized RDD family membrane protein YckC